MTLLDKRQKILSTQSIVIQLVVTEEPHDPCVGHSVCSISIDL